jgi:hypothetical protein
MAIAVPAKTAAAIAAFADVLFERWIAVYGTSVRLLSDRRKVFVSEVVQNLCAKVGTKKYFTSPYASQTAGMVDLFDATLCLDLAKFVTHEEDWVLCAAKDETSVEIMRRMFCCNFWRKSRL